MADAAHRIEAEPARRGRAARESLARPTPGVLLVTTQRWPTAGMLAQALMGEGFAVHALCPADHPLRALIGLAGTSLYSVIDRHRRLVRAMERARPAMVIAGDDGAVALLHDHYVRCRRDPRARSRMELIEASLGDPAFYAAARAKSVFLALARDAGAETPASVVIVGAADLARRLASADFPVVLKADGWSGGRGVRLAHDAGEAMAGYAALSRPLNLYDAAKDVLREASLTPLIDRARNARASVSLQAFIPGVPVNRAVVCRAGQVLGGRTVEAVQTMPHHGNATVVRPVRIPEVEAAVRTCVAALGLSGVAGFDFIWDEAVGRAVLLEVNPRATSALYTTPADGEALVARIHAAIAPAFRREAGVAFDEAAGAAGPIALFPQEAERDPQSPHLTRAASQSPVGQDAFVAACLARAGRRGLYEQAVSGLRTVIGRLGPARARPVRAAPNG